MAIDYYTDTNPMTPTLSQADGLQLLVDTGLLFEINRRVLHPLGLSLNVEYADVKGKPIGCGIIDGRADPEGTHFSQRAFDDGMSKLGVYMEVVGHEALVARMDTLGYVVQGDPDQLFTLDTLQKEQAEWSAHNFGEQPMYHSFLGMVEELGELAHAILKSEQNIRGSAEKHEAAAKDAISDLFIFAASFANKKGWKSLNDIVESTWNEVKRRDWKRFPSNGLTA